MFAFSQNVWYEIGMHLKEQNGEKGYEFKNQSNLYWLCLQNHLLKPIQRWACVNYQSDQQDKKTRFPDNY